MTAQDESTDVILVSVDALIGPPSTGVRGEGPNRIDDEDAHTDAAEGTIPENVVGQLAVSVEEFRQQWRPLIKTMQEVFQLSDEQAQTDAFHVDTVKVGLGVNANGKLFLIGNVGAKASVEVTFRRGPAGS